MRGPEHNSDLDVTPLIAALDGGAYKLYVRPINLKLTDVNTISKHAPPDCG